MTTRLTAVAAFTENAGDVPMMAPFPMSAAVMVWMVSVTSVAANVPVPRVSVLLTGKETPVPVSVVKNCTVPE